jgi:uncharacterized protein YegL
MDKLGASEYTIVQVLVDVTGSVSGFEKEIINGLKLILEACSKHPRSENVLIRVTAFNSRIGVKEIHGFMPFNSVDASIYDSLPSPDGATPLVDAHLNALESLFQFGKDLVNSQFEVNSVLFILSDGGENASRVRDGFSKIKSLNQTLKSGDPIESFASILIGFNDAFSNTELLQYQSDSGIDSYKSIGDATKGNLAKMATWVSQSVSTASVALGGGNSQQLSNAIGSLSF